MPIKYAMRKPQVKGTNLSEVNAMDNTGIQVTTDYDQFNLMEANREQSRGHIEALKAAFEEMGNLTRVQPILVNDRMEIIDGQHRFTACKELGQPIFFTQVSGLGVTDARQMNILHRKWEVADYARSYALGGDASYQRYLELWEDYGFSHSITLIYSKGHKQTGLFKDFREGNFTLTPEEMTQARERFDRLTEVAELTPLARTNSLAIALLNVESLENFDHNRMVSRLERNPQMLTRQAGVLEYTRALEDIYNHGVAAENRVRLF